MDELRKEIRRLLWDSFISARMKTLRKQETEGEYVDVRSILYEEDAEEIAKKIVEVARKAKTDSALKSELLFVVEDVVERLDEDTLEKVKIELLELESAEQDNEVKEIIREVIDRITWKRFFRALGEGLARLREQAETDPEARQRLDRIVGQLRDWAERLAQPSSRKSKR